MTTSVYICILLNFNINTEYTVCLQKLDTHVKLLYYWFYQKNLFFIKHCTWSKTNIQSSDFMSVYEVFKKIDFKCKIYYKTQ